MKNSLDTQLYENCFHFKENRRDNIFYAVLLAIVTLFGVLFTYFSLCFFGVTVSGDSMLQTLHNKENLLMRYVDDFYKADYGDVIIVRVDGYKEFQGTGTQFLIKRLIAKEGDKVRCTAGQVEVLYKGKDTWTKLNEPYAYYPNEAAKRSYSFNEYTVDAGEIFFLGDNRTRSLDSRYKDGGSRLNDLYKEEDIFGVVPKWAIEHQKILNALFFRDSVKMGKE